MDATNYPDSNLPAAQLNDALKELSTIDLIKYSIRSEKCKNDVKTMTNPRKVKLGISITQRFYNIEIRPVERTPGNSRGSFKIHINVDVYAVRSGTGSFRGRGFHGDYHFYFKDQSEGLMFMLNHLLYIFPCSPIRYLEVGPKPEKDIKTVIQWIKKQQLPDVEHCEIGYEMTTEMFLHILKNVRITSHLEIHSDFARELKVKLPESLEYFSGKSRWLTSKQLLSMTNYKQLDIWKSSFRNQHASAIINAVLGGGLPKLEYCKINIKCCNIDKILEKVEYEKIEADFWPSWETQNILKNGQTDWEVKALYDFDREDGKRLSLGHSASEYHPNEDFLHIYVRS
ncbi:unnamed protein product [Caenorhabditis brenneri]